MSGEDLSRLRACTFQSKATPPDQRVSLFHNRRRFDAHDDLAKHNSTGMPPKVTMTLIVYL